MLTYSVVGLGNLGEKISSNLLKQGFEVTVYDIDIKKSNKRTGIKRIFGNKHGNPHVDGRILGNDAPNNKEVSKLIKQLEKEVN